MQASQGEGGGGVSLLGLQTSLSLSRVLSISAIVQASMNDLHDLSDNGYLIYNQIY